MRKKPELHRHLVPLSVACLAGMIPGVVTSAEVILTPATINGGSSATTQYSDANVTLTPLQAGTPATFNANAVRLGIDDFGTNANAFNDPDTNPNNGNEEQLRFAFAANAGLRTLSWDFSRADGPDTQSGVNISGFAFDPRVSLTGAGTSPATYNASTGTLNIQLSGSAFVDPDGVLTLDPGASAGQTLLMTVTDTTQAGAQLAVTGISYEDNVTTKAPVITQDLPATVSRVVGLSNTLSVALEPGTLPAPTYLWEFDNGGGFVTVGENSSSYTYTAGPATDGTYRVTVSNSIGSDSSTTVASSFEDLVDSNRNSIGVTFAATTGDAPNINLGPLALAGAPNYVQRNWNATGSLAAGALTATASDIFTPTAGTLVDSSGVTTSAGFSVAASGAFSRPNNPQSAYGGLYSGYLFTSNNTAPVLIDLTDIPYARYDVVFYVMGFNENVRASIKDANSSLEYGFNTPAILASGQQPNWFRSADQTAASNGSNPNFPVSTHVIFRGMSGTSQSFALNRITANGGIAAIQIVEDIDTDGDGMGDNYEISVGLNPNHDGTGPFPDDGNPLQGAAGDFDGDGIANIDEHDLGLNPNNPDSDADGYSDFVESDTGVFVSTSNTGTDPLIADTDRDGLLDGVETNTGIFVSASNTGTNPLVVETDFDQDGWTNAYETNTGLTNPFDPESPGGPNPNGFAIAFNAASGSSQAAIDTIFGPAMYAGAPAVAQKNWNRTADLGNATPADGSGDTSDIATPVAAQIVDSSGAATAVGVTFTAGRGAFSGLPETVSPYGRLFNSFIYGTTLTTDPTWTPNTSINLTDIPYASYDVYVYFGSEFNGRTGTVGSSAAGTTYSFTTQVNSGSPGAYTQTTDTGSGNPAANYAVFSGQSSANFDVTLTVTGAGPTIGIYGIQVVDTSSGSGPFETWAAANISDPNKRLPTDDADADGFDNLAEFALFSDPDSGGSLPQLTVAASGADLTLTYDRANAATDVTFLPEWSTNLADWFTTSITDLPTGNSDANTTEYRATISKGADPAKFLRVRIVKP